MGDWAKDIGPEILNTSEPLDSQIIPDNSESQVKSLKPG